jgi:nucleoside-diphosphate-sugar epimerase
VDDLIDGLCKLFFTENCNTPINLGNPSPIPIIDLAREVIELTGSRSNLIFLPLPQDDPITREPDATLAKELLGWEASTSRTQGLTKTIDYFKQLKGL